MDSQGNPSEEDLLDFNVLNTLVDLGRRRGKDLLGQLFSLFLQQGPVSIQKLHAAVAAVDLEAVKSEAHSLKGSYRSLGLPRLAEICRRLEVSSTNGDLGDGQELLVALDQAYEMTSAALGAFINERGASIADA